MSKQKYLVVIEKGDNNYSAFSPDVPGCITTGETIEETVANMKDALEFHLEGLEAFPMTRGLKYYVENGTFSEGEVDENYFIAQLEVSLPVPV